MIRGVAVGSCGWKLGTLNTLHGLKVRHYAYKNIQIGVCCYV